MWVQCSCRHEFDVQLSDAGKRFRCPHCGLYLTLPGTTITAAKRFDLVAAGPLTVSGRLTAVMAKEPTAAAFIAAAGLVTAFGILCAIFLINRLAKTPQATDFVDPNRAGVTAAGLIFNPAVNSQGGVQTDSAGNTPPSQPAGSYSITDPRLASDFYKRKAPIEMTTTEWVSTLRDWGELPTWWLQWPYHEEHPWSYPLNYQIDLYMEVLQLEQKGHVADEQVRRLRQDFFQKPREYKPDGPNDTKLLADQYIKAARSSISREVMYQQLSQAATYLHSMLQPTDNTGQNTHPPNYVSP